MLLCNSRFYIQLKCISCLSSCTKMFSYALRQIQPRRIKAGSRARLPARRRGGSSRIPHTGFPPCEVRTIANDREFYSREGERRGSAFSRRTILSFHLRARAKNARPGLTRQERSGPAGRSVGWLPLLFIYLFFFLFTNCTATSVRFFYFCCFFFFTSVYYCWYLYWCVRICVCVCQVCIIRVLVCKMSHCPVSNQMVV